MIIEEDHLKANHQIIDSISCPKEVLEDIRESKSQSLLTQRSWKSPTPRRVSPLRRW